MMHIGNKKENQKPKINIINYALNCVQNGVAKIVKIVSNLIYKTINKIKIVNKYNVGTVITKVTVIILLSLIGFAILYVYIYVAKMTMIQTDDYTHLLQIQGMKSYIPGNIFHNAIEYAKWDCLNLGGRYFTMFTQCYFGLQPYTNYIVVYKWNMILNVILYFGSIFFVSFSLVSNLIMFNKNIFDRIIVSLTIFLSFSISFSAFNYYPQIFNWFPGATSYTIPLSCFLIYISCSLYCLNYKNFFSLFISFIFGIFSMGGSLCIVSTGIAIATIILAFCILTRKINLSYLILYFHICVFGIINLVSPGNYSRRVMERGVNFSIIQTLNTSIEYINGRVLNLFRFPWQLIVIIFFAGIISFLIIKFSDISFAYFITFPLFLLLPLVTTLPIVVGVGRFDLYINQYGVYDRLVFPIDFSLIILVLNVCVMIFLGFSKVLSVLRIRYIPLIIMVVVLSFIIVNNRGYLYFYDIHILEISENIILNKYDKTYNEYLNMMNVLESNRGKEYVTVNIPQKISSHYYNFEERGHEENFFNIKEITFK